jgi:hypothetical protein
MMVAGTTNKAPPPKPSHGSHGSHNMPPTQFAESAKLAQALKAYLKGLSYGR